MNKPDIGAKLNHAYRVCVAHHTKITVYCVWCL